MCCAIPETQGFQAAGKGSGGRASEFDDQTASFKSHSEAQQGCSKSGQALVGRQVGWGLQADVLALAPSCERRATSQAQGEGEGAGRHLSQRVYGSGHLSGYLFVAGLGMCSFTVYAWVGEPAMAGKA